MNTTATMTTGVGSNNNNSKKVFWYFDKDEEDLFMKTSDHGPTAVRKPPPKGTAENLGVHFVSRGGRASINAPVESGSQMMSHIRSSDKENTMFIKKEEADGRSFPQSSAYSIGSNGTMETDSFDLPSCGCSSSLEQKKTNQNIKDNDGINALQQEEYNNYYYYYGTNSNYDHCPLHEFPRHQIYEPPLQRTLAASHGESPMTTCYPPSSLQPHLLIPTRHTSGHHCTTRHLSTLSGGRGGGGPAEDLYFHSSPTASYSRYHQNSNYSSLDMGFALEEGQGQDNTTLSVSSVPSSTTNLQRLGSQVVTTTKKVYHQDPVTGATYTTTTTTTTTTTEQHGDDQEDDNEDHHSVDQQHVHHNNDHHRRKTCTSSSTCSQTTLSTATSNSSTSLSSLLLGPTDSNCNQGGGHNNINNNNDINNHQQIEISPGFFVKLRGTEETLDYIGRCEPTLITSIQCYGCQQDVHVLADAAMGLCPVCRLVLPLEDDDDDDDADSSTSPNGKPKKVGGVSLGLLTQDLHELQAVAMSLQEQ